MEMKRIEKDGIAIAVVSSSEKIIVDVQSALDLFMTVKYQTECSRIALNKEAIAEDFFVLSTCLAGEILQKIINYHVKFAVYGDFSKYTSKPLKDFIYESNCGNDIYFVKSEEDAMIKLSNAK